MQKLKLTGKILNKKNYEILKNIEILSFIEKANLDEYIEFIIDKLKEKENYNKFIKYLKKTWFINYNLFNYSDLLKYKINKDGDNLYLKNFYVTNNIAESLHSKINKYLPRNHTSAENFVITMKKVFIDNSIKNNNIIRYDIKTRAIIQIIKDFDLNNETKWIQYKDFKNYEKNCIKNINNNFNDSDINNIYKDINYYLEEISNNEESLVSNDINEGCCNHNRKNNDDINNIKDEENKNNINEPDDINNNISNGYINYINDINENIYKINNNIEESLDYSKDLNNSDLSIMNDNSDKNSDNIDNDELNDYDYNLLELYEEVIKIWII